MSRRHNRTRLDATTDLPPPRCEPTIILKMRECCYRLPWPPRALLHPLRLVTTSLAYTRASVSTLHAGSSPLHTARLPMKVQHRTQRRLYSELVQPAQVDARSLRTPLHYQSTGPHVTTHHISTRPTRRPPSMPRPDTRKRLWSPAEPRTCQCERRLRDTTLPSRRRHHTPTFRTASLPYQATSEASTGRAEPGRLPKSIRVRTGRID